LDAALSRRRALAAAGGLRQIDSSGGALAWPSPQWQSDPCHQKIAAFRCNHFRLGRVTGRGGPYSGNRQASRTAFRPYGFSLCGAAGI